MARLTTHVLDLVAGTPAQGVAWQLYSLSGEEDAAAQRRWIVEGVTNADGRCDGPIGGDLAPSWYELWFAVGEYFRGRGLAAEQVFLGHVPVRFCIVDGGGAFHVPLLISHYGYQTYRGS